jgi:photosystem II stability/assembly factor-like uncharacterized protein
VRRLALALYASTLFLAVASPGVARANGRFPQAGQLVPDPSDARHLVARTTYGVVQSVDDGASWSWICEKAIGYGDNFDPFLAVTGDATLVALFGGVAATHDRGCGFALTSAPFVDQFVTDLSSEATPGHAIALVSTGSADGTFDTYVAATTDAGKAWAALGAKLPGDLLATTLDSAPSRDARLYVSGVYGTPKHAVLEVSDDRGATWERRELGESDTPYLAAIDPANPDVVYLRLDGATADRALVSRDAGKTWATMFTSQGDLLGFARSPDGKTLALGGPSDGVLTADAATLGTLGFTKVADQRLRCLAWSASGLYACADEFAKVAPAFSVGRSIDAGKTWQPLYRMSALTPLGCAASTTTGATCPSFWPAVAATIGASAGDAGVGDAGGGGEASPSASGGCAIGAGGAANGPGPRALVGIAGIAAVAAVAAIGGRVRRLASRRSPPTRP